MIIILGTKTTHFLFKAIIVLISCKKANKKSKHKKSKQVKSINELAVSS